MWPFTHRAGAAPAVPPAPPAPSAAPAGTDRRHRATWDLAEGDLLGDGRRALRRLGGGSRCEVYLVWDEQLLSLAVAKVLRPDQLEDPEALADLAGEAALLARLAHPCLVRGLGATPAGAMPHILLEHVEGPTLQQLVKRHGPLPMVQLVPLALHAAAVLHYLSGQGVVHLDVKPGNVVMGVPPRVVDLSIARSTADAARLREAIGTDPFMAPEQCAPRGPGGPVGPAADVWGLGATLYFAACGEVPFPRPPEARQAEDPSVRFPQLRGEPPARLPDSVPGELGLLLERMMAPEPGRRPRPLEVTLALEPLVAALPSRLTFTRRGRLRE